MNKLENKDGSSPRIFIPITLSQIQDFKGDPEQDLNRGGLLAWSLFSIIDSQMFNCYMYQQQNNDIYYFCCSLTV